MNHEKASISGDSNGLSSRNQRNRTKIKHTDGLKTGELSGKMWRLGGMILSLVDLHRNSIFC
jgi:hypothetical protein